MEDDEDPDGVDGDPYDRHNPVNLTIGSPTEEEKTDRNDEARDEGRFQAILRRPKTFGADPWVHGGVDVEAVCWEGDSDGDRDREECQA